MLNEIRWLIINYLNNLETVFSAWDLNIVDTGVIEKQFSYILNDEKGWDALSQFRKVAGGVQSYPNTEKFISKMKEDKILRINEHPKL